MEDKERALGNRFIEDIIQSGKLNHLISRNLTSCVVMETKQLIERELAKYHELPSGFLKRWDVVIGLSLEDPDRLTIGLIPRESSHQINARVMILDALQVTRRVLNGCRGEIPSAKSRMKIDKMMRDIDRLESEFMKLLRPQSGD